jgi:2-iminobutanoate/2-iminopropanoate deaminase
MHQKGLTMKKVIFTENAPAPIGPYSQAIQVDNMLYCSGQIPLDAITGEIQGKDVEAQTEKVCSNIKAVLAAAGMTFDDVVKTTCFLTDMADFATFNQIYAKYFVSNPARSTVAVRTLPKNVLVEVEVVASK